MTLRGREVERALGELGHGVGLPLYPFDGVPYANAMEVLEWSLAHGHRPACDYLAPARRGPRPELELALRDGTRLPLAQLAELPASLPLPSMNRAMVEACLATGTHAWHPWAGDMGLPATSQATLVPGRPASVHLRDLRTPVMAQGRALRHVWWIVAPTGSEHLALLMQLAYALAATEAPALAPERPLAELAGMLGAIARRLPPWLEDAP